MRARFLALGLALATPLAAMADTRIIGGTPAPATTAPWVVQIRQHGTSMCTGSLVHERWILTAAHCVASSASSYSFWGGGTGAYDHLRELPRSARIIIHPEYASYEVNPGNYGRADLALVELEAPAQMGPDLRPIAIDPTLLLLSPAATVAIAGWGNTNEYTPNQQHLLSTTVSLPDSEQRRQIRSHSFFLVWPSLLAPSFVHLQRHDGITCNGDSGAGWVMGPSDDPRLVAVHVAGDYCGSLAIGTDLGPYLDWILRTLEGST